MSDGSIPPPPPAPFAMGPTFGSFYMSVLLCAGLWSITCMQTFLYFVHYQKDSKWLKGLVVGLWVLDTTHTILIVKGIYVTIIDEFGNFAFIAAVTPELVVIGVLFHPLIGIITQGFFVFRIFKFSSSVSEKRSFLVPILWAPTAVFQMVSCLIYVAKGVNATSAAVVTAPLLKGMSIAYLAVAAGVDILIALYLTYLLRRRKTSTEFSSSAKILQRLVIFSINSGIWTALFALCSIIFFVVFPTNLVYVTFDFPICAIYCNTLLANLNARAYISGNDAFLSVDGDLRGSRPTGDSTMVRINKTTEVYSLEVAQSATHYGGSSVKNESVKNLSTEF